MEIVIVAVILVALGYIVFRMLKDPDLNHDGKVDVQDVVEAVKQTKVEVETQVEAVVEKVKKTARKKKTAK